MIANENICPGSAAVRDISPHAQQKTIAICRTPPKPVKLKVAAYIRVSTDKSDQENSYEAQERYFNQLLSRNASWESAGVYADYGISGTCGQKRTGFKRILRHCMEGRIDRIVTKSISRFARNTADFMEALRTLRAAGATILFEKEGLDTSSAGSDFILTALAAIAQEESRSISENINWSNQKRFLRGDVRNQGIYGYRFTDAYTTTQSGYRYRTVEIVEEEAEVIRWIFRSYVDGMRPKEMARELNRRHVPHKLSAYAQKRMERSAKGQLNADIDEGWTSGQIGNILKNERYAGDVLVQKTFTEDYLTHKVRVNRGELAQYWVRDHHPAIISRELFAEAKQAREVAAIAQKHRGGGEPHALSGRLICGCCGRFYCVRNAKSNPIWYCPSTARNNGRRLCGSEKVYEEQVVRMFRRAISERFQLVIAPIADDVKVADIMSGRFDAGNGRMNIFSERAAGFVEQMQARLEEMQRLDFMERDRAFLQRRLMSATASLEQARSCAEQLQNQSAGGESNLSRKRKRAEEMRVAAEMELRRQAEQLAYMERYWEDLEADYARRELAIAWMKGLPRGVSGVAALLNGMTGAHMKAFALSIVIHDPLSYTVRWFDDTITEVKMYTNVADYRCTAAYFDGQTMREGRAKVRAGGRRCGQSSVLV